MWLVVFVFALPNEQNSDKHTNSQRLTHFNQAIHQMHRDIVATLPPTPANQPPVQVLASTPKCAIHGMYVPKKLITIQGHPEFNGDVMRKVMEFRREQGIFGDEIYADALARADRKQDGLLIAQAFLRFMLED